MRKIETTVYKYDELPEDIAQKALEKLAYINVEHEWWDSTYEDAERVGLKISEFFIDRGSYCKGKFIESATDRADKIIKEHGEACKTRIEAESFLRERDKLVNEWKRDENGELEDLYEFDNALDALEEEFLKSILEEYLFILRNEYEYLTSKEAIEETIQANEYEFNEKGELV